MAPIFPALLLAEALDDVLAGVIAEGVDQDLLGDRLIVGGEENLLLTRDITNGEVDGYETWKTAERLTDARFASSSHDTRHCDGVVVLGFGACGLAASSILAIVIAATQCGDWEGDRCDRA